MDLSSVITMDPGEAERRADEWAGVLGRPGSTEEERGIERGYRALAAGKDLIRLSDVIHFGGLDGDYRPRLAVAPVRAEWCYLYAWRYGVAFSPSPNHRDVAGAVEVPWVRPLPSDRPIWEFSHRGDVRAMVPVVPPSHRRWGYKSWHVLFEVPAWERSPLPPGDPALIQHLGGELWVVHSTWDLTPLEQAVLAERSISGRR